MLVEQGGMILKERSSPGICRSRFLTNSSPICSPIKVSRRLRTSILRLGRTSFPDRCLEPIDRQRPLSEEELLEKSIFRRKRQQKQRTVHSDINIVVEGLTNPSVKLANCCNPILGDDIVGYVSKNSGIVVHRQQCKNITYFDKARLIDVFWGTNMIKSMRPASRSLFKTVTMSSPTSSTPRRHQRLRSAK